MPVFIAMLRGINVSGQKIIKMESLRTALEALGFDEVRTYIQSGNIVFKTVNTAPEDLSRRIAKKLLGDFAL